MSAYDEFFEMFDAAKAKAVYPNERRAGDRRKGSRRRIVVASPTGVGVWQEEGLRRPDRRTNWGRRDREDRRKSV